MSEQCNEPDSLPADHNSQVATPNVEAKINHRSSTNSLHKEGTQSTATSKDFLDSNDNNSQINVSEEKSAKKHVPKKSLFTSRKSNGNSCSKNNDSHISGGKYDTGKKCPGKKDAYDFREDDSDFETPFPSRLTSRRRDSTNGENNFRNDDGGHNSESEGQQPSRLQTSKRRGSSKTDATAGNISDEETHVPRLKSPAQKAATEATSKSSNSEDSGPDAEATQPSVFTTTISSTTTILKEPLALMQNPKLEAGDHQRASKVVTGAKISTDFGTTDVKTRRRSLPVSARGPSSDRDSSPEKSKYT